MKPSLKVCVASLLAMLSLGGLMLVASCSDTNTEPVAPADAPGVAKAITGTANLPDELREVGPSGGQAELAGSRGDHITYLGGCATTYPSNAVFVQDNYAYVTSIDWTEGNGALDKIWIGTPSSPSVTGSYDCVAIGCLRLPLDVHVTGDYAYVADFCATPEFGPHYYKFNVTQAAPTFAAWADSWGNPRGITVENGNVYGASFAAGIEGFDGNLFGLYQVYTHDTAVDVAASGGYLFVADDDLDGSAGMLTVMALDSRVPRLVGSARTGGGRAWKVAVTPPTGRIRIVCVADGSGLSIFNATRPEAPVRVATLDLPGTGSRWVHMQDDYAYVAAGAEGIFVIDISDPIHPAIVGSYNTAGSAAAIHAVGNLLFVADGTDGLDVFQFVP